MFIGLLMRHDLLQVSIKHYLQGLRVDACVCGLRADFVPGMSRVHIIVVPLIQVKSLVLLDFTFILLLHYDQLLIFIFRTIRETHGCGQRVSQRSAGCDPRVFKKRHLIHTVISMLVKHGRLQLYQTGARLILEPGGISHCSLPLSGHLKSVGILSKAHLCDNEVPALVRHSVI